jgi:hypothetical protein
MSAGRMWREDGSWWRSDILLSEQRGPCELVADAVAEERAGFDFEVISDHYFPWLDAQGHSPYCWEPSRLPPFDAASQFVRPSDLGRAFSRAPDLKAHIEMMGPFVVAGFTHIALAQVGGDTQLEFLKFAAAELLPTLREEYGTAGPETLISTTH